MHTEATGLQGECDEDEQDDFGGDFGLDDSAERYVCFEAAAPAEGSACGGGREDAPVFQIYFWEVVVGGCADAPCVGGVLCVFDWILGSHLVFIFVCIGVFGFA
jgi:hypothetical protein